MSANSISNKKKSGIGKILLILTSIILVLMGGVYIAGIIYFQDHFFLRTTIGNVDVSAKNIDDTITLLSNAAKVYKLKATTPYDKEYEIKGKDIQLQLSEQEKQSLHKQISSQNIYAWPIELISPRNQSITVSYDEDALKNSLKELMELSIDPVNAYIAVEGDNYKIVNAKYGADTAAVLKEVDNALQNQEYTLQFDEKHFSAPSITAESEQIQNAKKILDNYLKSVISYTIGSSKKEMSKASILSLLDISDTLDVTINDEKLLAYVEQLAGELNTYGKERQFVTQAGDQITIGGGDYGFILDNESEAEQIKADLLSGKTVERQPMWAQTALGNAENDIGDTYVELDYANQMLYYVLNGTCVFSSDIVSGNINMGSGSPDGIFRIKYRVKDTHLKGTDYDGSEYDSPVDYFIVFAYNVGFHDASWQPWFGGNRYTYAGSHGCINLPLNSARFVYENISDEIPVVCYYRYPIQLTGDANRNSNAYSY